MAPLLEHATLDVVCHTGAGTGRQHTLWNNVYVERPTDASFVVETTGALDAGAAWNAAIDASCAAMRRFCACSQLSRPTAA